MGHVTLTENCPGNKCQLHLNIMPPQPKSNFRTLESIQSKEFAVSPCITLLLFVYSLPMLLLTLISKLEFLNNLLKTVSQSFFATFFQPMHFHSFLSDSRDRHSYIFKISLIKSIVAMHQNCTPNLLGKFAKEKNKSRTSQFSTPLFSQFQVSTAAVHYYYPRQICLHPAVLSKLFHSLQKKEIQNKQSFWECKTLLD